MALSPARYAALRDRTVAAVDRVMAEPVKLSFLKGGVVDPDRVAVEIEGILRMGAGQMGTPTGGAGQEWRGRVATQKTQLHVDRAGYPDLPIRTGDRVCALSRAGQPWWEVAAIDDRSHVRLVLQLNEI